jgi:hypothetical protein
MLLFCLPHQYLCGPSSRQETGQFLRLQSAANVDKLFC